MTTIQKVLISTTLALSIGLQWPLLQSVAWVNMLITYSQQGDLQQAVEKTFNGKNPCKLCKLVEKGIDSDQETQSDQISKGKKFDSTFSESVTFSLYPPALVRKAPDEFILMIQRADPPSPPPPNLS
ncbi:MAG: hypothetical protein ACO1QB_07260 [Verrucomicrobiales bacterium]